MLKRFACVAAALVVAFSLSLSSFASDSVQVPFPYFGRVRLSKGSTAIYTGSNGSDPITGITTSITDSSTGTTYYNIDIYPFGSFRKTFDTGSQTITYNVPSYHIIGDSTVLPYHQSASDETHGTFTKPYTGTISSGSSSVAYQNNSIAGGDYVLFGYFEYARGSVSSVDDIFTGSSWVRVMSGSHFVDVNDLQFSKVYSGASGNDVVQFTCSFTVPYSMTFSSIRLSIGTKSSFTSPIIGFGISSGGFEYTDSVNSIGGLSGELASWFSGLKSGISSGFQKIASLITSNRDDAAAAEESADHEAVSEAQSQVSEIESFESSLNSSITQSVSNIDFTVPSSFGSALGAIGFVFGGLFSDLGGYQVVITIPLILGIMLILIGRGTIALGRIVSANARAARRSDKGGEA